MAAARMIRSEQIFSPNIDADVVNDLRSEVGLLHTQVMCACRSDYQIILATTAMAYFYRVRLFGSMQQLHSLLRGDSSSVWDRLRAVTH